MKSENWTHNRTVRAVVTSIAFVALVSSILTVGLSGVAGAATVTGTFPTGTNPLDVALNPAGTVAYVANFSSDTVSVIALPAGTVTATIGVGTGPSRVTVDPTDTYVYVANSTTNNVSVIQVSTNTVVATLALPVNANPEQIFINSANTTAYVVDRASTTNPVYGVSEIALTSTPSTDTVTTPITTGLNQPEGIFVNSTDAYVTNRGANTVSVIQLSSDAVVATITVGTVPSRIAANPAGTDLYVTNTGSNNVSVIQVSNNTVVATVPVGTTPDAVAVDPSDTYAYVSNTGATNNVSVIDLASNAVVQAIPVGIGPEGIAVNAAGTDAYVGDYGSNSGSVILVSSNSYSTVAFNGNTSTGGSMSSETNNVSTPLTTNTFVKSGYTFAGWNTLANGTGTAYADGANYPFTSSTTLYAQWTANTSYTVAFNGNTSTGGSMSSETNNVSTPLTTNTFVKSGYTFAGWNTLANGTGTAYANGANYPFTSSTTLYAQWTVVTPPVVTPPVGVSGGFTVTFSGNGSTGGAMSPETATVPSQLATNAFVRTGYTFRGWNTAANGTGIAFAPGATYPFTASTTLYAQWTANASHTVIFAGNGANSGVTGSETDRAPTPLSGNAFVRTGYTFRGWNTAANGKGTAYAPGATFPFSADVTLYAQWVVDFYTVNFVRNGANVGTMRAETANAPRALYRSVFVRTGYTFRGWNTAANGKGIRFAPGAVYPFKHSVKFFAQWTPIPAHAHRIIGSAAVGQTRRIIIVGSDFFNGTHVTSNEGGTVVRVGRSAATEIFLTVTVRQGSPRGRHIFTIVTASKRICRISYNVR